jgi:aspartate/methionine/tyrosine aminotransferase
MLDAMRRRGLAVIDLTASNPTQAGLDYPPDLLAPLASSEALRYEPSPLGLPRARAAVAADFERRGLDLPPERIALTASTSEAYALLFKLFCDAGDEVLVPQPSYPLLEHLTELELVRARPYRLEYHGTWRVDVEHLCRAIGDRTRAVLVVSPNNPTGSRLHRSDLAAIAALCRDRELALIGDEVFADYPLDDAPDAVSVLAAEDALVCCLGGLSKSVGLPQVKLGWIGFQGPVAIVDAILPAYELIADTYLSVSTPAQVALPALLERGAPVRAAIHARLARNLAALRAAAASTPAVTVLACEGGWSAVIQVPAIASEEMLVLRLLTEDQVLVHPGFFFDFEREAFLVVSLLVEPTAFDAAIARLLPRVAGGSGRR